MTPTELDAISAEFQNKFSDVRRSLCELGPLTRDEIRSATGALSVALDGVVPTLRGSLPPEFGDTDYKILLSLLTGESAAMGV